MPADLYLLNRAHQIAFLAHHETGETRGGPDNPPYYTHPVEVAAHVLNVLVVLPPPFFGPYTPAQVAAAAVLHDVPEDTDPKWTEEIRKLNPGVLELALMLKNAHLDLSPEQQKNLTRFDKKAMDFAKLADPARTHVAVVPIKYADRIHNLQTVDHWKLPRQLRYAAESRDLLAILDARMVATGMPEAMKINDNLKAELLAAVTRIESQVRRNTGNRSG